MASHGYEEIDHTADIALRVWGKDLLTLLKQAAEGMYNLVGFESSLDSSIEIKFDLQQGPSETILVDFLSELLYLLEEKAQGFQTFFFDKDGDQISVRATGGKVLSIDRHIKAVTFHNLNIENTGNGLEATITFDV